MTAPMKVPPMHGAGYLAGAHIHANGPQTMAQLFAAVSFGVTPADRRNYLAKFVGSGWLTQSGDVIDISGAARTYFDALDKPAAEPYKGEVAGVRTSDAMHSKPLRKAFIPSSKGFRDDIPEYSQRTGDFQHRSAVGC